MPLRIPENLDELAALSAQTLHIDKASALRQWLHEGASHYVLQLVDEGRMSIGRAAELLDLTVYELYRLAEAYGIELGATNEQRQTPRSLMGSFLGKANEIGSHLRTRKTSGRGGGQFDGFRSRYSHLARRAATG